MTPPGAEHQTQTDHHRLLMTSEFRKTVTIKAVDDDERTATGAVLVPDELDHQHDFLRPDAVRRFHSEDVDTGVMHAAFPDDAAMLERSEVITEAEEIGSETFPPGTWVASRRYEDDQLWELVQDGVLQGFSIGGTIERAAEHDDLPEDVRVPDSVDHDAGGTELLDGVVREVSDVDIPAVPRARYKSTLGKSLLEEVDGVEEFVELMVEQRGHEADDARRLYRYLTSRQSERGKSGEGKPGDTFEECKVEVAGTEVDLTPPVSMVSAAQGAADAAEEDRIPSSCGTGTGDRRRDQILDGELSADVVREVAAYLVSHEEDVTADGAPGEWSDEEWADCGNAQYAKWGGTGGGEPMEWAMRRVNEIDRARDQQETYPEVSNSMTDADSDEPSDATKWQILKGLVLGSDDGAEAPEASGTTKASDGDDMDGDDDEDDEDDEEGEDMEQSKDATGGDTSGSDMTDDTEKSEDPPAWADALTETVEQIDKRVSKLEADDTSDDGDEKALDDAPEWARDLAEKVDDLDERVDTISKQSGHSQQLDGGETPSDDGTDEVEAFKKGLVGGTTGGD